MWNLKLDALVRTKAEKLKDVRSDSMVPWIVYWNKEDPISLKIDYSEFLKTFRKSWSSNLIDLKVGKKEIEVLVHQLQKEPITWDFLHVDFYAITRWQELTTKITLNFIWEAMALREWAIIDEHIKEIEVKCLPKNLVDSFDVDLTSLANIWDSIRVSDLKLDTEKYTILNSSDDMVVAANAPAKIDQKVCFFVPEHHVNAVEVAEFILEELESDVRPSSDYKGDYVYGCLVEVKLFSGFQGYREQHQVEAMSKNFMETLLAGFKNSEKKAN